MHQRKNNEQNDLKINNEINPFLNQSPERLMEWEKELEMAANKISKAIIDHPKHARK